MNPIRAFFPAAGLCLLLSSGPLARAQSGPPKLTLPAASPAATVKQRVGLTDVEVEYSRPTKNGREIFGRLVPYNEVWRTGANASTKVTFSDAVRLGGKEVPAGKYALYTIPAADEWTVILYKDLSLWGAVNYKPADDFARFPVKPETAATPTETFAIGFDDLKEDGATMFLAWDRVRVPVRLTVDTPAKVAAAIARATAPAAEPPPTAGTLAQAAAYYLTHDGDLAKALTWINAAIEKSPSALVLHDRKARIQAKMGDKAGAITSEQKEIELATEHAKTHPEEADASGLAALQKFLDGLR